MELKIVKQKEPELKFKKQMEISVHKRKFVVSKKPVKAVFHAKPKADILGNRKRSYQGKLKTPKLKNGRYQVYNDQRRRKQALFKSAEKEHMKIRDSVQSPEESLKDAFSFSNEAAKDKYKRNQAFRSVKLQAAQKSPNPQSRGKKIAVQGVRKGGAAVLTQVEGGEEANEALHVMETAARPAQVFSDKGKYQREEKKLKIKQADGKITSKRFKKELNQSKKKIAGNQRKKAIRQRQMQYMLNKLTGSGGQDSLLQVAKDMAKMKASVIMLKVVKFLGILLAPLFGLLLTVAIPVVIIAMLFYASPVAAFMPAPSDNDTIRTVLSGYYTDFNTSLGANEGGTIEYLHNQDGNYVSNYMDTLMVYMVQYGTGDMGVDMDEKHKKYLKEIFDEMNSYENTTITTTIKAGQSLGNVVTSGYCQCSICCGKWAGGPTASGVMPTAEHTLAVDASNPFVPMGTKIIMNGIEYKVEDTGAFDQFGVQFDVFCGDHATASAWGHQTFEAFLADGDENEITVTKQGNFVKNLNYEDYIKLGKLTDEQEDLLREVMSEGFLDEIPSFGVGSDVANLALTKVGYRYSQADRYAPDAYDCSSLVQRLYREFGVELPDIASTQGQYIVSHGLEVTVDALEPGDLIFYSYETNGQFRNISHVAIYIGNGRMVHASSPTRGVVNDPLRPSNIGLYGRPSMGK
ncbi:MAG: NlpC/P60 family protein [Lachnospiraceae bacterium]